MPFLRLAALAILASCAAAQIDVAGILLGEMVAQISRNLREAPIRPANDAQITFAIPESELAPPIILISVPSTATKWSVLPPSQQPVTPDSALRLGYDVKLLTADETRGLPHVLSGGKVWRVVAPSGAKGSFTVAASGTQGRLLATYASMGATSNRQFTGFYGPNDANFTGDRIELTLSAPEVAGKLRGTLRNPAGAASPIAVAGPDARHLYRATFTPRLPGKYEVEVPIPGHPYPASVEVRVLRRGVHFSGFSDAPADTDNNQLTDSVNFTLRFNVLIPGSHRVAARFRTSSGKEIQEEADTHWSAGPQQAVIKLHSDKLLALKNDGPIVLASLHVFRTTNPPSQQWELAGFWNKLGNSRPYARATLDRGWYYFSDDARFTPIDANNDGLFESLRLAVPVTLRNGGKCHSSTTLYSGNAQVHSISRDAEHPAGTSDLVFYFSGSKIHRAAGAGPFTVHEIRMSCGRSSFFFQGDPVSASHRPEQFELIPESISLIVPPSVTADVRGGIRIPVRVESKGGFDGFVKVRLEGLSDDPRQPYSLMAHTGESIEFFFVVPHYNPGGTTTLKLSAEVATSALHATASVDVTIPLRDIAALKAAEAAIRKEIDDAFARAQPSPQAPPKNVVLLLDRSGSLHLAAACQPLRNAARAFAKTLRPTVDALSVVLFDSKPLVESPLTREFKPETLFPNEQRCSGNTNTAAALDEALRQFPATSTRGTENHLILFTDGLPSLPGLPLRAQQMDTVTATARNAHNNPLLDLKIHVIALGGNAEAQNWYKSLANGHYLHTPATPTLELTFAKLAELLAR